MADEALNKVMERLEELSNQMNEIRNVTEADQNAHLKFCKISDAGRNSERERNSRFIFRQPGNKEQYKFSRTILNLAKAGLEHYDKDVVLRDGEEGVFELLRL